MEVDSRSPQERIQGTENGSFNFLRVISMPFARLFSRPIFILLIAVVIVVSAAAGYFLLNKSNSISNSKPISDTKAQNEEAAKQIIEDVGKLTLLPNEIPTVATIADMSKLQKQPFFAKALNGDKVLIFEKAKRAILYRPSTNKIIEIGPVSIPSISPTGSATPSASVSVIKSQGILLQTPIPSPIIK